jgi:ubiquinone/menaquinone biosynthesis C-methylase UbiE
MRITKFWKLYPITKRTGIEKERIKVNQKTRKLLQKFGKEYFDGDRSNGYGGYYYNKKFFFKIAKELVKHYRLNNKSKILDIGCAKGFLMHDLKKLLPKAEILGIDISSYCKNNALKDQKKFIKIGCCSKLPYKSDYFDLVLSISTIHNLNKSGIKNSLNEINRVKKDKSFIRVKAYKNVKEKKFIDEWNVVAKSNLSISEWKNLFKQTKYEGDYDFSTF